MIFYDIRDFMTHVAVLSNTIQSILAILGYLLFKCLSWMTESRKTTRWTALATHHVPFCAGKQKQMPPSFTNRKVVYKYKHYSICSKQYNYYYILWSCVLAIIFVFRIFHICYLRFDDSFVKLIRHVFKSKWFSSSWGCSMLPTTKV